MYTKKSACYLMLGLVLSVSMNYSNAQDSLRFEKPKNIIILFADGTAGTQWEFGRYSSNLLLNKPFLVTGEVMTKGFLGLMSTYSHTALVTDSAAAGTAMSTGYKANNGAISMTPDGQSPATIMEVARKQGKRIGLASTAPIYDASPAAFSVHSKLRKNSQEIVDQYAILLPDVLLGGGADYFKPKNLAGGKRTDGQNMMEYFSSKNYQVVTDTKGLMDAKSGPILGLFANEDMAYVIDEESKSQPSLAQMTSAALKALSTVDNKNQKGFVLFVENENTDSAGHKNDAAALMRELWVFDDALRVALDFQKKNPSTLIIVTGDHETGGFSPTYAKKVLNPEPGEKNQVIITQEQFNKIASFKMSLEKMGNLIIEKQKSGAYKDEIRMFVRSLISENLPGINENPQLEEMIVDKVPLGLNYSYLPANILGRLISEQTGFYWGGSGHTSEPSVIGALGPGAQIFKGYQDNTDFAIKLKILLE